jgi:prepilin-type N-terminal cleavage/methylation domain-containing protein
MSRARAGPDSGCGTWIRGSGLPGRAITGDIMIMGLPAQAGVTLIEVLVAMTLMTIFMSMVTTGVVQMYRAANKSESISIAQSQLRIAFQRLDKEVRYASGISRPGSGVDGSAFYVEYLTTNDGARRCRALRLRDNKLQQHVVWTEGAPQAQVWNTLAAGVSVLAPSYDGAVAGVTAGPFTFFPADATTDYQRLQLSITATYGSGTTATRKDFRINFTALNSTELLSVSSPTFCTGRRP